MGQAYQKSDPTPPPQPAVGADLMPGLTLGIFSPESDKCDNAGHASHVAPAAATHAHQDCENENERATITVRTMVIPGIEWFLHPRMTVNGLPGTGVW